MHIYIYVHNFCVCVRVCVRACVFTRDTAHGRVLGLARCQAYAPTPLSLAAIVWVAHLAFFVASALWGGVSWGAVVVAKVFKVVRRKLGKAGLTLFRVGRSTLGLDYLRHDRRNCKPHNLYIMYNPRVSTLLPL